MKKTILATILACVLVVGCAGCQGTVEKFTGQAWNELKRIAQQEGEAAAEKRIEQAKEELRAKGLEPGQIDSMAELLMAYLEKRDSDKGPMDYTLMMNLLIAYLGGSVIKRKFMPIPSNGHTAAEPPK